MGAGMALDVNRLRVARGRHDASPLRWLSRTTIVVVPLRAIVVVGGSRIRTMRRRHPQRPGICEALGRPAAGNNAERRTRGGAVCPGSSGSPRRGGGALRVAAAAAAVALLVIRTSPCSGHGRPFRQFLGELSRRDRCPRGASSSLPPGNVLPPSQLDALTARLSSSVLSPRGGGAAKPPSSATAAASQEALPVSSPPSSSPEPLLKSFLRARCGPTGAGVWVYEGRLVDPLNGLTIASVRGVELVRCLAVTDPSGAQRERYRRRAGDLAIAPTVSSASLSPNLEYAGTLLCRKLFCYTLPGSGGRSAAPPVAAGGASGAGGGSGTLQLLRKVRLRPTSPERTIPVDQAAAVYDTATTYCQVAKRPASRGRGSYLQAGADRPDASGSGAGGGDEEVWAVHTEYSDGRCLYSAAAVHNDPLQRVLEYTVYARPQPAFWNRHQRLDWARWLGPYHQQQEGDGGESSSVLSPRRAALVQLGPSSSSGDSGAGRFGARETYQYATAFGRCSCRYTRYGEGPAWYGPGRMCTLELSGKRVDRWTELPADLSQLVYERVVGFSSVNSPVPQDDNLASRAVQVFRGMGASRLRIAPLDKDGDGSSPSALATRWNRVLSAWDRVKGATSLTLGGGEASGDGEAGRGVGGGGSSRRRRSQPPNR